MLGSLPACKATAIPAKAGHDRQEKTLMRKVLSPDAGSRDRATRKARVEMTTECVIPADMRSLL
jgi:hypothetical protein